MSKHFILEPLNCWWTWHRSLLVYLFSNTKFKAQFVLSKLPLSRSPLQFPSYFVEICLIIAESTIHESFQNSRNFFTTTHNLNDSYLNRMRREQKKLRKQKTHIQQETCLGALRRIQFEWITKSYIRFYVCGVDCTFGLMHFWCEYE